MTIRELCHHHGNDRCTDALDGAVGGQSVLAESVGRGRREALGVDGLQRGFLLHELRQFICLHCLFGKEGLLALAAQHLVVGKRGSGHRLTATQRGIVEMLVRTLQQRDAVERGVGNIKAVALKAISEQRPVRLPMRHDAAHGHIRLSSQNYAEKKKQEK